MEKITINKQEAEVIKEALLLLENRTTISDSEYENLLLKINKFLKQDDTI